jgi:terminase small subunit-like protein
MPMSKPETGTGRPSDFNDGIAERICDALLEFDDEDKPRGLRAILLEDGMPGMSTLFRWLDEHDSFREQYARARELQAHLYAEVRMEIASENPKIEIPTKFGSYTATDAAGVARNRLRYDAASKHAGQLNPKKYGERIQQEHSGPDGGPVQFVTKSILDKE